MRKKLLLLGSTGSIGTQTLSVVDHHPEEFEIEALAAHRSVDAMVEQIAKYHPKCVCMVDKAAAKALKARPRMLLRQASYRKRYPGNGFVPPFP